MLMLLGVVAIILLALLVFTDTYNDRMSKRFARDTEELSGEIAERADDVIEEQAQESYAMQARGQAQSLDLLLVQVEAAVDLLADFATRYAASGYGGEVEVLHADSFADRARRPRDMALDADRGVEVSWAYPTWHAPAAASRSEVTADVRRFSLLRDPMVALCRNQRHLVFAYVAFPSRGLIIAPGNASFAGLADFDPTQRLWYSDAMAYEGGRAVWQEPYLDAATGRLTVTCSRAFRGRNGAPRGVVAVDVSLAFLESWLSGLAGEDDLDAYLVDRDLEVVHQQSYSHHSGSWDEDFEPVAFDAANPELRGDLAALHSGVQAVPGPDGTNYLAYSPIPTVDWNLVLVYPNTTLAAMKRTNSAEIASAFDQAQQTTDERLSDLGRWFMVSIVFICAVVMLVVAWTLSWRFSRPVERIIGDIRVVSTGNLEHRMSHQGDDELGELARAFDDMTEQLRRTRDQLREHNRTLEQRVSERTGELSQRNEELNQLYEEAEHSYMQLKAAQSQLVQHERMATLGQLVAGIAHEINNPVNFLINSVRPLRQVTAKIENVLRLYESAEGLGGVDLAERMRKIHLYKKQMAFDTVLGDMDSALDLICNGAERTGQIVENLRVFSRTEQTVFKSVDLRRGLDITISLLAHHLKNRIHVHKDYQDVPLVECNPGQINQVFMNLLSNASQAIHGDGDLWIEVRRTGRYVRVRIRDNGVGIPEDHLYRIFEPFFTTKGEAHGTGLGLSITHNIIQEHGGTIEVRSELGKGTEFTVSLPVVQASVGSTSQDDESLENTPGTTKQLPMYRSGEHRRVTRVDGERSSADSADDDRSEDTYEFATGASRAPSSDTYRDPGYGRQVDEDTENEPSEPSDAMRTTREMIPGEDPLAAYRRRETGGSEDEGGADD